MLHRRLIPAGLLLAALLCSPAMAAEPVPEPFEKDIVRLIDMTGGERLGLQFARAINEQFSEALRQSNPEVPDRAFVILNEELVKVFSDNIGSFVEMVVPIYAKYFTHEEIKGMIAFYQTELGQKTLAVVPQVMNESMLAGQQWGRSLAPDLIANLRARFAEEGLAFPE